MPVASTFVAALVGLAGLVPPGEHAEPAKADAVVEHEPELPRAGETVRVGGDRDAVAKRKENGGKVVFVAAGVNEIDTALPEGYPAPTPPGAIDVKSYPVVRRAVVEGEIRPNGDAGGEGFWPLFRHIQRRDIAMTSPVEMEYKESTPEKAEGDEAKGAEHWTMAFLYRRPDQGEAGQDGADKRVKVEDAPPVLVIAIGMKGDYSRVSLAKGEKELETWLAAQKRFERAGATRVLYYHGPTWRPWRKWSEVQIPVAVVGEKK